MKNGALGCPGVTQNPSLELATGAAGAMGATGATGATEVVYIEALGLGHGQDPTFQYLIFEYGIYGISWIYRIY